MRFEGLGEQYEEFRESVVSADPSLEGKLDDEKWQEQNKERIARLKTFLGVALVQPKNEEGDEGKSLTLIVRSYLDATIVKDGLFFHPEDRRKVDKAKFAKWWYGRGYFWNPVVVAEHVGMLETYIPLEKLMEGEENFAAKVEKVHDSKWSSFLTEHGYDYHKIISRGQNLGGIDSIEELMEERRRIFVSKKIVERIDHAYNLIVAKENEVSEGKGAFNRAFPDFEERLCEINRIGLYGVFYFKGNQMQEEIRERGISDLQHNLGSGEFIPDHAEAERAMRFLEEIKGAKFMLYKDLKEAHPEIEEKLKYLRENDAALGKANLHGADFHVIRGLSEIDTRRKRPMGRSRMWRSVEVESKKRYDVRIVETIDSLYNLMKVTDKVYAMIEQHRQSGVFWKIMRGLTHKDQRYFGEIPYIKNGRNYSKGNLLMLIERTAEGNASVNDVIQGNADSYQIDNYWSDRLEEHSRTEETKRDRTKRLIISERQLPFFKAKLLEIGKMVNTAIDSLYKQPA